MLIGWFDGKNDGITRLISYDFRAKIEADYAKKLKAWNEKMIKALEASTMYGSHQKGLITITAQSEKIANHHQQIHDKIHSDCSTRVGPYNRSAHLVPECNRFSSWKNGRRVHIIQSLWVVIKKLTRWIKNSKRPKRTGWKWQRKLTNKNSAIIEYALRRHKITPEQNRKGLFFYIEVLLEHDVRTRHQYLLQVRTFIFHWFFELFDVIKTIKRTREILRKTNTKTY